MKKIFEKKIFKPSLILLVFFHLIFFMTKCRTFSPKVIELFQEGVRVISGEKNDAEVQAKKLKTFYQRSSPESKKGEIYYSEARAKFDSWITEFQSILQFKSTAKESDPVINALKESLKKAAIKSYKFKEYVKNLTAELEKYKVHIVPRLASKPSTKSPESDLTIFSALLAAVFKIRDAYIAAKEEKRNAMIKQLEDLRWKSFEEIK